MFLRISWLHLRSCLGRGRVLLIRLFYFTICTSIAPIAEGGERRVIGTWTAGSGFQKMALMDSMVVRAPVTHTSFGSFAGEEWRDVFTARSK